MSKRQNCYGFRKNNCSIIRRRTECCHTRIRDFQKCENSRVHSENGVKTSFLSDTFSVRSTLCFMSKEHEGVKISDQIYTSAIELILKSHLRDSHRTSISLPFSN